MCEASAAPAVLPFLRQRRLPSILLDSWEFRKLASEGSVLANAIVSHDVDDDGLEEVIVGTTEGLLCVVKPDCRAPLFLRVLAATISVVLYTPGRHRLVLVTLEGQCEVIDHFLKPQPHAPQRTSSEPASAYGVSSTDVMDGSSSARLYQRTDSTNSLPLASTARGGGVRPGGRSTSGGTALPTSGSHTSLVDRALLEVVNSSVVQPTHAFHVPSNCLSADLSPDTDADLIFLGSYDRRFYVYSIPTGSCLLSLFMNDPITSIKAFAIPVSAADACPATTSAAIAVHGRGTGSRAHERVGGPRKTRAGSGSSSSGGTAARARRDGSMQRRGDSAADAAAAAAAASSSSSYIPLVFLSTPTHLVLLPGGLSDIQRWRKLQPKSAHLPLTVQLHGDDAASTPPPEPPQQQQQLQQQQHDGGSRTLFNGGSGGGDGSGSGGGSGVSVSAAASATVRVGAGVAHEGTRATPTRRASVPLSATARAAVGGAAPNRPGGATPEHDRHSAAALASGGGGGGVGGGADVSGLSGGQQRRQARRRAIQAAEMGRPVLVKPLWAMRIGSHTLDVPLLHAAPTPESGTGAVRVAQRSSAPVASERAAQAASAGGASPHPARGGRRSSVVSAHGTAGGAAVAAVPGAVAAPPVHNSSIFSISSPSLGSTAHGAGSLTNATSHSTASPDRPQRQRRLLRGGDGGDETETSYASRASLPTVGGLAAASAARRSSWRGLSSTLPLQRQESLVRVRDDDGDGASDGDDDDSDGGDSDGADVEVGDSESLSGGGGRADVDDDDDDRGGVVRGDEAHEAASTETSDAASDLSLSTTSSATGSGSGSTGIGAAVVDAALPARSPARRNSVKGGGGDAAVMSSSLMDLVRLDRRRHRRGAGRTSQGGRPPARDAARDTATMPTAAETSTAVRLPTSVDVSVGASQVAVALSCEDGLALELRFSVVRLSSLTRRERRLPRRTVRLYDMRNPPRLRAAAAAAAAPAAAAAAAATTPATQRRGAGDDAANDDRGGGGGGAWSMGSASSPASATHGRSRQQRRRRRGASSVSYNIYLPTLAPATAPSAALSSHFPLPGAALASRRQRSRCGRRAQRDSAEPLRAGGGSGTAAGAQLARGDVDDDALMLDNGGGGAAATTTITTSPSLHAEEEDSIVLRAQCRWAARLGSSPLVQRSRVFYVRDRHLSNAFCTVFVAANGTCFAIDGDTLSVVECTVKDDCSSFTLMAGPSTTSPAPLPRTTSGARREASTDVSGALRDGDVSGGASAATSPANVNLDLLRGSVGRMVSCVCVSVDELCVYSVGEANLLVGHRDCAASASPKAASHEPVSLLSRCAVGNGAARPAEPQHNDDGASAMACALPSTDAEEQALLRQLAIRLCELEKHVRPSPQPSRSGSAVPSVGGDTLAASTEEEMLLRVRQMLLYGYSEQQWERLQWLDHAVT
ncbi:Quinonprotein alcohol dehydrogenase-like protein [Novymonas esmeraldas]|uniref:Quinonprotein alcohol dehydrogenase-like protein n=1 Tax=Novymonas esmeraldas TaxID=1808958 RepID=A0AAW0F7H4_9TRYP